MAQDEWSKLAAKMLKVELARADVSYEELIEKLKEIGIEESYKGISSKINRGTFSFAFFMQCMKALNQKVIRLSA